MPTETYPYRWTTDVVDITADDGTTERAYLLWVCVDCLNVESSGEELDPDDRYEHDGQPCEPWSVDQGPGEVTPGRLLATTDDDGRDAYAHDPDTWTEGYETRTFGTTRCDGCGCSMAGTRHAYTYWQPIDAAGAWSDHERPPA